MNYQEIGLQYGITVYKVERGDKLEGKWVRCLLKQPLAKMKYGLVYMITRMKKLQHSSN
jgi:hypothetical protein